VKEVFAMIELPEAIVIAQQMSQEYAGKRIASALRGNTPHKFAFYSRPAEEYESILPGKTLGPCSTYGGLILVPTEPGYLLTLGGGGERILLHRSATTLPKKHHLLLRFEDDTHLTVTVQGWGSAQLLTPEELTHQYYYDASKPSPLSDAFSWEYFQGLFAALEPDDARAVKFFVVSKPGVLGVGNGVLQDILWRARIHPRRRAALVTPPEQRTLYATICATLREMVAQGGRSSEHDLYNALGGYQRILDSTTVGQPCPACGMAIEKIQFLGGAAYYCPRCQV
jgi:formamidopyrimidine-DNA glycosylase